MINIFKSPNALLRRNDDVSLKVIQWLVQKKAELTSKSRTCALWFNYLMYVEIIQQYIEAERKNDWSSHVSLTKQIINLFAATGHNNYAKTCRLYIQSISHLERDYPEIFEQFTAGNHTVKHSEKTWSGIWTDLSIEQILMRSLKGRGGVIAKGMTENVLIVWTKTMHRCAEVPVSEAIEELTSVNNSLKSTKKCFQGAFSVTVMNLSKFSHGFGVTTLSIVMKNWYALIQDLLMKVIM